ncbi:hypothetical protein [uncultured Ramlibacter sp.]|uniref:hypothetical protein n=1 Tax=uncultured Ramlibacter sp. TaxID=260755 RepID=UPI00345C218B
MTRPASTAGYGETAADLILTYEHLRFEDVQGMLVHLHPQAPADVLDIGAAAAAPQRP